MGGGIGHERADGELADTAPHAGGIVAERVGVAAGAGDGLGARGGAAAAGIVDPNLRGVKMADREIVQCDCDGDRAIDVIGADEDVRIRGGEGTEGSGRGIERGAVVIVEAAERHVGPAAGGAGGTHKADTVHGLVVAGPIIGVIESAVGEDIGVAGERSGRAPGDGRRAGGGRCEKKKDKDARGQQRGCSDRGAFPGLICGYVDELLGGYGFA